MFACFKGARKRFAQFFAFASLIWLAACDVTLDPDANVGRDIDLGEPIEVASEVCRHDTHVRQQSAGPGMISISLQHQYLCRQGIHGLAHLVPVDAVATCTGIARERVV